MKKFELSMKLRMQMQHMLVVSVMESVTHLVKKDGNVRTHLVMGANINFLKDEDRNDFTKKVEETHKESNLFKSLLDEYGDVSLQEAMEAIPIPMVTPLPTNLQEQRELAEHALNDTQSTMYVHVTEAIGVKKSVLNQNEKLFESRPSETHPDCQINYVVMSVRSHKLKPRTYAAKVTRSIIDRDGNFGKKLGNFKPYTSLIDLPNTKYCTTTTK